MKMINLFVMFVFLLGVLTIASLVCSDCSLVGIVSCEEKIKGNTVIRNGAIIAQTVVVPPNVWLESVFSSIRSVRIFPKLIVRNLSDTDRLNLDSDFTFSRDVYISDIQ
jgi:hypothetical protein